MKIDTYTKVVLTGIAVFLGGIAFDYRPNMEAKAGIMGGGEMIMKAGNALTGNLSMQIILSTIRHPRGEPQKKL